MAGESITPTTPTFPEGYLAEGDYNISYEDWFEWNGTNSNLYGMHVLKQPSVIMPRERTEKVTIPGRPGSLTILEGDDIYDNLQLSASCVVDKPFYIMDGMSRDRISTICQWLKGDGTVKFATRSNGFYKARISNQISFDKIVRGTAHRTFQIMFECEPFFYLDSGTTRRDLTPGSGGTASATFTNQGNTYSCPLIMIRPTASDDNATSDSTITISFTNGEDIQTLFVQGAYNDKGKRTNGYITIDTDAKIATNWHATTATLFTGGASSKFLNSLLSGDWLRFTTGQTLVSVTGIFDGVYIWPRWRCVG